MREITEQREYNSKTFDAETGAKVQRSYPVPIHYFNKLGIGDGKEGWRGIDHILSFNAARGGWEFLFNNFLPLLPEFADGIIEFRDVFQGKDQTITYQARAAHVKGELRTDPISDAISGNYVIYPDAFGAGIDLILGFKWAKLVKLARVRNGFYPAADLNLDFEIGLPASKVDVFNSADLKTILSGTKLVADNTIDTQKIAFLDNTKSLYIGKDQGDGKDWFTILHPFRAWDSGASGLNTGMKVNALPWQFFLDGSTIVMRKTVPASFFTDAVGDVFTDAVTTYYENKDTYYGTTFTTGGAPESTQLWYGGWGDHYYGFVEWDLSGTPKDTDTSLCRVFFYVEQVPTNDPVPKYYRVTSSWTETGVNSTTNPTFDPTPFATPPSVMTAGANFTDITTQYNNWRNGSQSNFGLSIRDTGSNTQAQGAFASSDNTDLTRLPYLEVTYAYHKINPIRLRPAPFRPGLAR